MNGQVLRVRRQQIGTGVIGERARKAGGLEQSR